MSLLCYLDARALGKQQCWHPLVLIWDRHTGAVPPTTATCSVCGEPCDNDIRLLNHMMERHGWRNPSAGKPDRNSRGY